MIKQVERFHCGLCDYIAENPHTIKQIKKDGICPACNNGKGGKWEAPYDKGWTIEDKTNSIG